MNKVKVRPVAATLMKRDIVTVSPTDTLKDALALMVENHLTGLPVMDDQCRCVGLITSSDILSFAEERSDGTEGSTTQYFDSEMQQWETMSLANFGLDEFGEVPVAEVMSRDLIWVERETPLKDVAKRMMSERIHRVLVMDKNSNLYGIISAYDFVRLAAEGRSGS
jgi:CBS domain-containing protein